MKNIVNREGRPIEWLLERVEYMSQFMMPEREQTIRRVLAERSRYITVCMENGYHPHNASALIRHCDAFGMQNFHTIESQCDFNPNRDIVRGSDQWLTLSSYNSTREALSRLREDGYRIVATSPHQGGDFTPEDFDVSKGKFALIFGSERSGVSDEVRQEADAFIRIPMCGFAESLNVSASAAILLYLLSSRVRESELEWRLSESESAYLLLDWIMLTVRESERILAQFEEQR